MDRSRRVAIFTCLAGVTALLGNREDLAAQNPGSTLPPASTRRRDPGAADNGDAPFPGQPNATKTLLEQRQKDIKKNVEKLFDLASELKAEVEKTDATAVLSMAMLKKTEEIEKLAKQIRDNARG